MILRFLAFICLITGLIGASFFLPPESQQIVSATSPREKPVPELEDPRLLLAAAAQSLSAVFQINEMVLSEGNDAPRMSDVDLSRRFRSELSAIVMNQTPPEIWMVDPAMPAGRRRVVQGDAYLEGWTVRQILPAHIVLERGGQTVTVDVFASAP